MRGLIQRVSEASVEVAGAVTGRIDRGLLLFLGIDKGDGPEQGQRLLSKVLDYRVFADDNGHMNLSVSDVKGGLLVVSQFTLSADTNKGLRPSFSSAAPPALARELYDQFLTEAVARHDPVASGVFGADMQVRLINDGPVTFLLAV